MRRFIFVLSCLGLLQSVQAEIMESNITIQIKLYYQKPNQDKNGQIIKTTAVQTLKTSDVIAKLTEGSPQNFTSKARLLNIATVTQEGNLHQLIVREKGKTDLLLSSSKLSLDFASDMSDAIPVSIDKGKYNADTEHGSSKTSGNGWARYFPAPVGPASLVLRGVLIENRRTIPSKEVMNANLYLSSRSITGAGSYDLILLNDPFANGGYAQGSIKYSTPKILPVP